MDMTLHHQNFMLSVRREMGWPTFKPANDCITFCSGRVTDSAVGSELARITQRICKDAIYTGWTSTKATEPTSFTIAYRETLLVHVVDRVVPYAANDEAPIVLVSTRADEFFAIDRRGSLVRGPGKPKNIQKGRKLAISASKPPLPRWVTRCWKTTGSWLPAPTASSRKHRSRRSSGSADLPGRTSTSGSANIFAMMTGRCRRSNTMKFDHTSEARRPRAIVFAYESFKWSNLAANNAGVTVVVTGIARPCASRKKSLCVHTSEGIQERSVSNINAYLVPAQDIFIDPASDPLNDPPRMYWGCKPVEVGT